VQAEKLSPGAEREQFVGMAHRVEIANEWPSSPARPAPP
jgi:hypothetical protein